MRVETNIVGEVGELLFFVDLYLLIVIVNRNYFSILDNAIDISGVRVEDFSLHLHTLNLMDDVIIQECVRMDFIGCWYYEFLAIGTVFDGYGESISEQFFVQEFASPTSSPIEGIVSLSVEEEVEQTNCFSPMIIVSDDERLVFGKASQSAHGGRGGGEKFQIAISNSATQIIKALLDVFIILKKQINLKQYMIGKFNFTSNKFLPHIYPC